MAKKKSAAVKEPEKKSGRPLKEVDEKLLEHLTRLHLSDKVISEILEVHPDTLHSRFSDKMDVWRSKSKGKIAEVLFDEAINNRKDWALKTVAQKHLDYSDKVKTESEIKHTYENLTDEEIEAKYQATIKKIKGGE